MAKRQLSTDADLSCGKTVIGLWTRSLGAIGPAFLIGGYFERAGPSPQSRCLSGGGAAHETERVLRIKPER